MAQDYECSDKMFRLGWLEDAVAEACLSNLAKIADGLKGQGAYESDTIAICVEPLLRGLGWETLNHNEVDRAPSGNHPDFELYGRGKDPEATPKRVAVIEVKSLDTPDRYLRQNASEQLYGYVRERLARLPNKSDWVVMLGDQPIVCGVVTNGKSWLIYDFHGEGHQDLKCEFNLQGQSDVRMFVKSLGKRELLNRLGL
jgi:hypothetical protein